MPVRRSKAPALKSTAKYDAAGTGRRVKGWNPASSGPQRATEGLQRIRDRARDSTRNDWGGESGVQKWTTNLVGVGITPRWDEDRYTKIWDDWVPFADADGVLDAYGLQTLAVRSWLASGEVFLRRRPRDLSSPLPQPMQVQLIEADFVPLFDADLWDGMPPGNNIRQGIERNKYGRRVAYWLYKEHPGDKMTGTGPSMGDLVRVAASEISHVFEPTRPGQLRGVSMLAPILVKLRASMDFEDAVLDRQKLANLFTMFVTRQMPDDWEGIEFDSLTGLPKFYDTMGNALVGLEPGTSQELAPGEDVKFTSPPDAGTSYPEYMRTTHMGTAAGQGLPYEIFSGDIRDVSDRTLRVAINEFRRFARSRQWQTVIPQICRPVVRWLGQAALLKADLAPSDMAAFMAPTWSPEGWEYIHPVQDVEGKIKARDAGLTSTSQIIADRGDDPRKVLKQIKADEKSGLTPKPEKPAAPSAPAPAPKPQPSALEPALAGLIAAQTAQIQAAQTPLAAVVAAAPAPSPIESAFMAFMEATQAQAAATQQALFSLAQALAERPLNVAAPTVHNHMAAPEPTPVDVHVAVQPTPVDVHVAAPSVVNHVAVQPAEVKVELPDRKVTSVIERNQQGDITNVTQTETTLQ